MGSSSDERRKSPRKRVTMPVKHRTSPAGAASTDFSKDLSASGVFVQTRQRFTLGQTLHLELSPPRQSGKVVRAIGEVTRVTPDGIGAHFRELDPDSAMLLNLLLSV